MTVEIEIKDGAIILDIEGEVVEFSTVDLELLGITADEFQLLLST